MNSNKTIRLYNVLFPIWFFYLIPGAWLYVLPINFVVDSLVIYIGLKLIQSDEIKMVYKNSILKAWGFGFLSDFIGSFILLGYVFLADRFPAFEPIADTIMSNPFKSIPALLCTLLSLALSGYFIYLFNKKFTFKGLGLNKEEIHKMALWLAIFTAPYTFLIPTTLIYR